MGWLAVLVQVTGLVYFNTRTTGIKYAERMEGGVSARIGRRLNVRLRGIADTKPRSLTLHETRSFAHGWIGAYHGTGGCVLEVTVMYIKIAGAAMGSLIAVVFRPGGDKAHKLMSRFVIGAILGFISAPLIIDFMGWTHTPDFWLAAATFGGLLGYLTLQLIFSREAAQALKKRVGGS